MVKHRQSSVGQTTGIDMRRTLWHASPCIQSAQKVTKRPMTVGGEMRALCRFALDTQR